MISKILDFFKSPQVLLLIVMLLVNEVGVLLRSSLFESDFLINFFMGILNMGLPIFISWLIHLIIYKINKAVAWGSGLAISITGAYCTFVLLDPEHNKDANIGLIVYLIGGFLILFIPAGLIGGLLGYLSDIFFQKNKERS